MLGVTIFGVFLTPVFFYVIQGIGEMPALSGSHVRRTSALVAVGVAGMAIGSLLGWLGLVHMIWGPVVGFCVALAAAVAVSMLRRRMRVAKPASDDGPREIHQ